MKKKKLLKNDEVDLIDLFKIIWSGKLKIFSIIIISFIIGLVYIFQLPNNNVNSLIIKSGDFTDLRKIKNLYSLLEADQIDQQNNISNQSAQLQLALLRKFIRELNDYEEYLLFIKNTKTFQKDISKLNLKSQKVSKLKYINLFNIDQNKSEKEINYTLNFVWHDQKEAYYVLKNALELASNNLKVTIYNDLNEILKYKKKKISKENLKLLTFLKEQASIARNLNFSNNQTGRFESSQRDVNVNINTNSAYYLRGFIAIEKEIELIQNREYPDFLLLQKSIDSFKDSKISFVNYNIELLQSKPLKNKKNILMISVIMGLILGMIYVLALNSLHSQTTIKKT